MKTDVIILTLLVLVTALPVSLQGQDVGAGIGRINQAYLKYSKLSMDVSYAVFSDWYTAQPLQKEKGSLKRSEDLVYTQIGQTEFVQNRDYSVIVDHEDKTIGIMGIYGDTPKLDLDEILTGIEMAVSYCKETNQVNLNERESRYILVFPDRVSEYQKVFLDYNLSTNLLTRLTLFYARPQDLIEDQEDEAPPRLEISYSNINVNPSFSREDFTYESYLKKKGNAFICTSRYQGYQLIDKYSHN